MSHAPKDAHRRLETSTHHRCTTDCREAIQCPPGRCVNAAKGDAGIAWIAPTEGAPLSSLRGMATMPDGRTAEGVGDAARGAWGAAVPPGWKLVPVEPTDAMVDATHHGQPVDDIYRDMLAAVPIPPAAQAEAQPAAPANQWAGTEEWMPLAWALCADECGEEACSELIWEGGPVPEPWGERWLKYEGVAQRLIALVRRHVPLAAPIPPDALLPAEREDSDSPCPRCGGEGTIVVASDNGPDAHDVDECCPHCEGHGTLDAAYRGLLKRHDTLQAELSKVSGQLWGLKHVREARDAFLLEVGEDLARWVDPVGYWKERTARADAAAKGGRAPLLLKGTGKVNGDGWKDATKVGEVVYAWNREKPAPYVHGQFPRLGNPIWSASTAQYSFEPMTDDEAISAIDSTIEALRSRIGELHDKLAGSERDAARYRWLRDVSVPPHNFYLSVPVEFDGVRYAPADVDAYIDAAMAQQAKG